MDCTSIADGMDCTSIADGMDCTSITDRPQQHRGQHGLHLHLAPILADVLACLEIELDFSLPSHLQRQLLASRCLFSNVYLDACLGICLDIFLEMCVFRHVFGAVF